MNMLKSQIKQKKETKTINLKITVEELQAIQDNANHYTGGNLSAWLRYAGSHYVPKPSELAKPSKK